MQTQPVGRLLYRAQRIVSLNFRARLRKTGLNPRQWGILSAISQQGPMPVLELAERLFVDPTSLSRTIYKMEQANLIKRTISEHDRRKHVIDITEFGKEKVVTAAAISKQWNEEISLLFAPSELSNLKVALIRLIEKLPHVVPTNGEEE